MASTSTPPNAGLCEHCVNARVIENPRGSTFILCELSATDPRFPKYPRLPVLDCDGFREKEEPHNSTAPSP